MKVYNAYIGAGSNIGDKLVNCHNGIVALSKSQNTQIKEWSKYYKTDPVGYEEQDWFINVVVKIETTLDPFHLLKKLKSIEHDAGRIENSVKFGPRILDLDILLFDDLVINSSGLVVPHPRMHERRFVLKPICDIDPKIVHPVLKKEMRDLLAIMNDNEQRIIEYK